jgi:hypothetical protein
MKHGAWNHSYTFSGGLEQLERESIGSNHEKIVGLATMTLIHGACAMSGAVQCIMRGAVQCLMRSAVQCLMRGAVPAICIDKE